MFVCCVTCVSLQHQPWDTPRSCSSPNSLTLMALTRRRTATPTLLTATFLALTPHAPVTFLSLARLGETHVGRFKAKQHAVAPGGSGHASRDGSPGRARHSPASGPGPAHSHDHDHDLLTGGTGVSIASSASGRPVGGVGSSAVTANGTPNPALRTAIQAVVDAGSASGAGGTKCLEGVSRPGDTSADHSINGMPHGTTGDGAGEVGDVESGGLRAPLLKDSVAGACAQRSEGPEGPALGGLPACPHCCAVVPVPRTLHSPRQLVCMFGVGCMCAHVRVWLWVCEGVAGWSTCACFFPSPPPLPPGLFFIVALMCACSAMHRTLLVDVHWLP